MLSADWEVAFGMSTNDGAFTENTSYDNMEVVLAGKFEEADDFEKFIGRAVANDMNYSTICRYKDGVTYWTSEDNDFYYARYKNIFILTNTDTNRENAINRLINGNGFSFENNYDNDKLAYAYVNGSVTSLMANSLAENAGQGPFSEYLGSLGEVYASIESDSEGFITSSIVKITDSNNRFLQKYIDAVPVFVNKVPAKGIIAYMEDPDLSLILETFAEMAGESYENLLTEIGSSLGVTVDDVGNFLSSPFAFSLSETGSFMPSIALYLELGSGEDSTAEILLNLLDQGVDQLVESTGGELRVVKSQTTSGLTKIAVDIDALPTTNKSDEKLKALLKESGVEFYYGILDDTMIIAFYPNFEEYYEINPLSKDTTYKTAVEKLNGVYGGKLSYVNITNTVKLIKYFIDLSADESGNSLLGEIPEDALSTIEDVAGMFKYVIGSTEVTSTKSSSRSYLRMGK
jgi:hypothetical protein